MPNGCIARYHEGYRDDSRHAVSPLPSRQNVAPRRGVSSNDVFGGATTQPVARFTFSTTAACVGIVNVS
jgi:hypothetical protein